MKNIPAVIVALVVFCAAAGIVAADNSTANSTKGIIYSPKNYVVRDSGFNASFKAYARFGTPCFSPPYYQYEWYLNTTLIGTEEEFSRGLTDFPAGNYTLTVKVTDCMTRTATDSANLYLADTLKVNIVSIQAGGTIIQSTNCTNLACDTGACNPKGKRDAADYYLGGKEYFYNRTSTPAGSLMYLTYDGSLLYDITDPNVTVLFPDKCNEFGCVPKSFYTVLLENGTGEFYVLIGEDDFVGGLPNVPEPHCREICSAFKDDFIPIVSGIYICAADVITENPRQGSSSLGYTEIIASNTASGKKVHFIFSDNMDYFLSFKKWSFNGLGVDSGTARLSIGSLCQVNRPMEYAADKCLLNFSANVTGGLPPYNVKWISSGDGVINRFTLASDPGIYEFLSTPPMAPPLSNGTHNLTFYAEDQLGLSASTIWRDAKIPWCCAIETPCQKYWPGRDGPNIDTGNENSYSCDIYEVCRPELWTRAREATYCCENNCTAGCMTECRLAYNYSKSLVQANGMLTPEGVKKCSALYMIYGFGPGKKYMTDYYYPEICCEGGSLCSTGLGGNCCEGDVGTCSCGYHTYNRNAQALPCQGYVSTSSRGWKSDIAMNLNTCMFSDLSAYASMEILNTGTCVDYATSVTTMLRILGYGPDEVYTAIGPSHAYNMVKFPDSPKYNIIDTTGNKKIPYVPNGLPIVPGGYDQYCSYEDCRNDAGQGPCPSNIWGC
ncbi:MAG: hypothetical protein WAX07_07770 [Candidatus Altiarchaeia archaeon]